MWITLISIVILFIIAIFLSWLSDWLHRRQANRFREAISKNPEYQELMLRIQEDVEKMLEEDKPIGY